MIVYGACQLQDMGGFGPTSFFRTEMYGDTVIGAYHYSKLYDGLGSSVPSGGIRNDTLNKKVYRYFFATGTEYLLYDFNLAVGDTVNSSGGFGFYADLLSYPGSIAPPTIDTAWVTSIDSILMPYDGIYHRRFNFKAKINGYDSLLVSETTSSVFDSMGWDKQVLMHSLIEGVGQMNNPISHHGSGGMGYPYQWYFGPLCSSINGVYIVNNFPWTPPGANVTYCSSIFVGIDEETKRSDFVLYPNPTNGKFQLEFENSQSILLEITDVLGKTILTQKIIDLSSEIDLSFSQKGIYFVKAIDDKGNFIVKKIIKN